MKETCNYNKIEFTTLAYLVAEAQRSEALGKSGFIDSGLLSEALLRKARNGLDSPIDGTVLEK